MSGMMLAFSGGSYGAAPVNTVAPVVSGTASFGSTLTTTNGTWTGAPAPTFTYQWQRVTTNISGATSSTYVLVAADVGNTIRCVVKATNIIAPSGVTANSNSTASVAAIAPGAPTIGTATQTGSSTATVVYTAPASNGGATITSYTATSSPSGITGTLSQAGSGTITVSGLAGATAYTFTVTATNSAGTSAASAASNSITTLPTIGQSYQGGYFAGQISTAGNSVADYNLVVGPAASALSGNLAYSNYPNSPSPTSVINGPANSAAMNHPDYPAAKFCEDLNVGGYTDWYMGAKNELEVCYFNLKPSTQGNTGSVNSGINANAVPARAGNYTGGNPAQTTATVFQVSNAQAYESDGSVYFWCSTQSSNTLNFCQRFANGYQATTTKETTRPTRAIRRVAV
jgi:hypothetical protein